MIVFIGRETNSSVTIDRCIIDNVVIVRGDTIFARYDEPAIYNDSGLTPVARDLLHRAFCGAGRASGGEVIDALLSLAGAGDMTNGAVGRDK